jgi:hypothetical protein
MVVAFNVSNYSLSMSQTAMDKEYYENISNGIIGPEDFAKKSFEFLLKREGKDSILKEIQHQTDKREYFPEYETEIKKDNT